MLALVDLEQIQTAALRQLDEHWRSQFPGTPSPYHLTPQMVDTVIAAYHRFRAEQITDDLIEEITSNHLGV